MNSFSKNKFLVLGFMFAIVLLIPANDAFAQYLGNTGTPSLTITDA